VALSLTRWRGVPIGATAVSRSNGVVVVLSGVPGWRLPFSSFWLYDSTVYNCISGMPYCIPALRTAVSANVRHRIEEIFKSYSPSKNNFLLPTLRTSSAKHGPRFLWPVSLQHVVHQI